MSPRRFPRPRANLSARVDETAHAVGEEHVDLLGLDQRRHLADAEDRVRQRLARAVRARTVVRLAGLRRGARGRADAGLERAPRAALRTVHARDASGLRHRRDDVPPLLAAHGTELLDAL